eukprot:TRINITY_DN7161_c0_g1_i1.p1 TRINITY_DN7161_c0_g1~~TRINITY_DN7161_c0_g1_i1.p1  ORF type:complete len:316 (-),score=62.78 TRINITY_DN7161_c0_g1_i1:95-1042(-)
MTEQQYIQEMYQQMNEQMNYRWKVQEVVEQRIKEQSNKVQEIDRSEQYGIPTNLWVIDDYILKLYQYVFEYHLAEFLKNVNTPFGFSQSKRLKLIHGYDSFVEQNKSEHFDSYITLPFVLSEDLFIEFEQNIIGNGETEKEQIIKEFQHIHNKSIFDTFNEALNLFRPYYTVGGPIYPWTKTEKSLFVENIQENKIKQIFDKAKKKVFEWGSQLCGLINDTSIGKPENFEQFQARDIKFDPNRPLASLVESMPQEHECIQFVREEKLSSLLLKEIFEGEYKWQLYEDEKAEVIMELSDLVFEDLVEEFVVDLAKL